MRKPRLTFHLLRRLAQIGVVVAAVATGYRFMAGLSLTSVERYCPMGGVATSYSLATDGRFSCATGEMNVAMIVALVALALVARKAFCSWLCPVGTVSELAGAAAAWLFRRSRGTQGVPGSLACYEPPVRVDRWLRAARFAVFAVLLVATFRTAELVFRPYCPYYVMFSFHGHEVQMWSYALLAVFLAGVVAVPFLWCRYLCPLGAALWPFARFGLLRIRRNEGACTGCRRCDRVCGHSLPVSSVAEVQSGECTLCLECVQACPAHGALGLSAPKATRVVPALAVPLTVALAVVLAVTGGNLFAVPSFSRDYGMADEISRPTEVRFVVRGVRCVDTAKLAATVFDGAPGVLSFVAYASRSEVVVAYDAARTDVKRLVKRIQGPVFMEASGEFVFRVFQVMSIDGAPVPGPSQEGDPSRRRQQ